MVSFNGFLQLLPINLIHAQYSVLVGHSGFGRANRIEEAKSGHWR